MGSMIWSLYKDTRANTSLEWEANPVAWFIDYDALKRGAAHFNAVRFLHDGKYEVFFDNHSCILEVKDGKWDIPTAKEEIRKIVDRAGYHGRYIELFFCENGKYHVTIGS